MRWIDWFIPAEVKGDKTELPVWRNFVFTHIAGPIFSQSISIYLWRADHSHGFACWTMTIAILGFLALPFVLKFTRSLVAASFLSVQLLSFASLFGAFNYGGVSSPFLPWLLVAVLLGYFYISDRPRAVTMMVCCNIAAFAIGYGLFGFPELGAHRKLGASRVDLGARRGRLYVMDGELLRQIMSIRSELERETERHRETVGGLAHAPTKSRSGPAAANRRSWPE